MSETSTAEQATQEDRATRGQLNRIEQLLMIVNERLDRIERRGPVANGGLVTSLREALAKALAPPRPTVPHDEGWRPTGACGPSADGTF